VAGSKLEGLVRHFDVRDERTLEFFRVHGVLDVEHSDAERRIVADGAAGQEDEVLVATEEALDAWWAFLDAFDVASDPAISA
jgi:pyrroloquinoline quinone (PQQ) biosynthesis protein C